jgi:hypothetical protein
MIERIEIMLLSVILMMITMLILRKLERVNRGEDV